MLLHSKTTLILSPLVQLSLLDLLSRSVESGLLLGTFTSDDHITITDAVSLESTKDASVLGSWSTQDLPLQNYALFLKVDSCLNLQAFKLESVFDQGSSLMSPLAFTTALNSQEQDAFKRFFNTHSNTTTIHTSDLESLIASMTHLQKLLKKFIDLLDQSPKNSKWTRFVFNTVSEWPHSFDASFYAKCFHPHFKNIQLLQSMADWTKDQLFTSERLLKLSE
jgi:hypothetical protein